MKRIILTGATGLIGSKVAAKLIERGDEVVVFSRNPNSAKLKIPGAFNYVEWNYDLLGNWTEQIDEADSVIHLAGENVMGGRWTTSHKNKVEKSRFIGTKNLVDAICKSKRKPVFICASAIGFYDNSINKIVDENSEHGSGFLSYVTQKWEEEATNVEKCGVRRVSIRTGIVLEQTEGALAKMLTPFKFFIGGPLGSGKQWMPWIHIADIAALFIYAVDNEIHGAFNGVAPNVVTMNEFSLTIGKILNRPSIFKIPEFVLKLVLGEAVEVVTKGSKVFPKKTLESGFQFRYTDLSEALRNILD
ncbi:MAG: TIGR01777 family protein [Ignavibacteriales bacterium]|jgi:uncharacterized protein (TIGR01777 family)|nr:MAG: TIGR01777 family protein [Ignavibacteriales bacterium]